MNHEGILDRQSKMVTRVTALAAAFALVPVLVGHRAHHLVIRLCGAQNVRYLRLMNEVEELIEESIEINVAPDRVWALVTDLPRMAKWSPQVVKTIVRGGTVGLGSNTININRRGALVWPTRSTVVRFEENREFAFRIKDNFTIWSFNLEATDAGTRLTQRREAPEGTSRVSAVVADKMLGGQKNFQAELRQGMQQTLRGIKSDAEA